MTGEGRQTFADFRFRERRPRKDEAELFAGTGFRDRKVFTRIARNGDRQMPYALVRQHPLEELAHRPAAGKDGSRLGAEPFDNAGDVDAAAAGMVLDIQAAQLLIGFHDCYRAGDIHGRIHGEGEDRKRLAHKKNLG